LSWDNGKKGKIANLYYAQNISFIGLAFNVFRFFLFLKKSGRGLYVSLSGQGVVILRFFIKMTQKTPEKEIKFAK
jgi:phage-related protein